MTTPAGAVVVAVGTDGYDAALTFAVAEARRAGRPLHLVHVLTLPAGEPYAGLFAGMLEAAQATLAAAHRSAVALADPEMPVTSELLAQGGVVDQLVRHTRDASVLVVQHRDLGKGMGKVRRAIAGSFAQSLAARSHVPVVSVPEAWHPRAGGDTVVTAAVQQPDEAAGLLRFALEEARARGGRLSVLHAWWLAFGYDVVVADDRMRTEHREATERELAPVLASLRADAPGVEVSLHVRHAPPVEAVLDAADVSDLMVIGRRHHLLPLGSHLGPVARAALGHATCPVLVTPELPVADTATMPREAALVEHLAPAVPS